MTGSLGRNAGKAEERPATAYRRDSRSTRFGPAPAAGAGSKPAPLPGARLSPQAGPLGNMSAAGEGRGGGGRAAYARYLDTDSIISSTPSKQRLLTDLKHALVGCGRGDEAQNLATCGKAFQVWRADCGTKLLVPIRCHHPLCSECSRDRSIPLQRSVLATTRKNAKKYKFITLTLVNTPSIDRLYVANLISFFGKLRKSAPWREKVSGGIYSIETTYNRRAATWHVHLHALVEVAGWLPASWIYDVQAEWRGITGDSWVVNMQAVNKRAVKELVKYQAKVTTFYFSSALVDEYLVAFKGVRRLQRFGSFLGAKAGEEESEPVKHCKCGLCGSRNWRWEQTVPISETRIGPDGKREVFLKPSPPGQTIAQIIGSLCEVPVGKNLGFKFA